MSMNHAQSINFHNAESNQTANPSRHSFKNSAENYHACFSLFIPLDVKEVGAIIVNPQVMERCLRGTRDVTVEAGFVLMRFNSGREVDLWTLIYVLGVLLRKLQNTCFLLILCELLRK